MKYDTWEIRSVAQKVKRCASNISGNVTSDLRSLEREIEPSFEGEAAEMLKKRLKNMQRDTSAMQQALSAVAEALYDYAEALEEIDRKLAAEV